MILARPDVLKYKGGDKFGFMCMSDLHLGARTTDVKAIKEDLETAKQNGYRININGDVFEAITPRDMKRFDANVLTRELCERKDILNASVDLAYKLLAPYAELIDVIGRGNHEDSALKHNSVDLVLMLIDRLQALTAHKLYYGDSHGFIHYRFEHVNRGKVRSYVIYYHHGGGGAAPITKGIIDFNRINAFIGNADLIWIGHKHNRIHDGTIIKMVCPKEGNGEVKWQKVDCLMTGAYKNTYEFQRQESIHDVGCFSNFASDKCMAPQRKGGAVVLVSLVGHMSKITSEVVM